MRHKSFRISFRHWQLRIPKNFVSLDSLSSILCFHGNKSSLMDYLKLLGNRWKYLFHFVMNKKFCALNFSLETNKKFCALSARFSVILFPCFVQIIDVLTDLYPENFFFIFPFSQPHSLAIECEISFLSFASALRKISFESPLWTRLKSIIVRRILWRKLSMRATSTND